MAVWQNRSAFFAAISAAFFALAAVREAFTASRTSSAAVTAAEASDAFHEISVQKYLRKD